MLTRRLPMSLLLLLAATATATAHPGHDGAPGHALDAAARFLHPFTGVDHLLVMLAVGFLAMRLGGRALWALPAAFLTMMTAGAALGSAGVALPSVELGIALSVIGAGAVIAVGARPSTATGAALAGFVALFHGHAHGSELGASSITAMAPFVAATALLHLAGIGLGFGLSAAARALARQSAAPAVGSPVGLGDRLLGTAMIVVGFALLLG